MPSEACLIQTICYMHSENIFYEKDLVESSCLYRKLMVCIDHFPFYGALHLRHHLRFLSDVTFFLKHEIHRHLKPF